MKTSQVQYERAIGSREYGIHTFTIKNCRIYTPNIIFNCWIMSNAEFFLLIMQWGRTLNFISFSKQQRWPWYFHTMFMLPLVRHRPWSWEGGNVIYVCAFSCIPVTCTMTCIPRRRLRLNIVCFSCNIYCLSALIWLVLVLLGKGHTSSSQPKQNKWKQSIVNISTMMKGSDILP